MAGWSGLWDDGGRSDNKEPHALVYGETPGLRRSRREMQRRGTLGLAKANGGVVPATRKRGDYITADDTPGPAQNFMKIPGTADGAPGEVGKPGNPPLRDIEVLNAHGDVRPLADDNTTDQVSAAWHGYVNDTRLNFEFKGDLSGNGAPPLTPGDPAAPPYS